MSVPKEPLFFETEHEKGTSYYRERYFSHWSGESVTGDACNRNLFVPFVPERIHETNPEAKLIVCLRDPVERAYSHWWDHHSVGLEPLSFGEAVERNLVRLERGIDFTGEDGVERWRKNILRRYRKKIDIRYYLDAGYYAEQLERYFSFFSRDQFAIRFLDELKADAGDVIRDLWTFIGVSPEHRDELSERDLRPRHVRLGDLGSMLGTVSHYLGASRMVPDWIKEIVRSNLKKLGDERPPMDEKIERILREHYAQHNRALIDLLPEYEARIRDWGVE